MEPLLSRREAYGSFHQKNKLLSEDSLLERLGVSATLEGHDGCVNTLCWNSDGRLLASGSDDRQIIIWGADGTKLDSMDTGHLANIFGVEFLPYSHDRVIATGAGDHCTKLHDLQTKKVLHNWLNGGRIKRIGTALDEPFLFWTACEDSKIRQHDARGYETEVSIELDPSESIKTLAICQGRTELIAVGVEGYETPIFDRRNLSKPLLILASADHRSNVTSSRTLIFTTHVTFDYSGTSIIVNQSGGSIYLYDLMDDTSPTVFDNLDKVLQEQRPVVNVTPSEEFENGIRKEIKDFYADREYHKGIERLNTYLASVPVTNPFDRSFGYTQRAKGYLARRWSGDTYDGIRDCIQALLLHPGNSRALFWLCRGLLSLEQWELAKKFTDLFKQRYPDNPKVSLLESRLSAKIDRSEQMMAPMDGYKDYTSRYCGHTNSRTDMKEANFFGSDDQYIAAGSDGGFLMIWERATGNIKAAFRADDDILNVVQPHPSKFMLATSGIEDVVRFWEPLAADVKEERREHDVWDRMGHTDFAAHIGRFAMLNGADIDVDDPAVELMERNNILNLLRRHRDEDADGDGPPCRVS